MGGRVKRKLVDYIRQGSWYSQLLCIFCDWSFIAHTKIILMLSNVKTVKEQTFHKRSTNVPMSNRNETKKRLSRSRICVIERDPIYLVQNSGQNRNNLFSIREIRERYQNVLVSFQTISERLSFRFWHCLRTTYRKRKWGFAAFRITNPCGSIFIGAASIVSGVVIVLLLG
jgi:hypothetical protein